MDFYDLCRMVPADNVRAVDDLGQRLKYAIKVKLGHRKLRELARQSGVQPSTISRISKGKLVQSGPETLDKLARALDVSFEWLARNRGPMDRTPSARPNGAESFQWPAPALAVLDAGDWATGRPWSAGLPEISEAIVAAYIAKGFEPEKWSEAYWYRFFKVIQDGVPSVPNQSVKKVSKPGKK